MEYCVYVFRIGIYGWNREVGPFLSVPDDMVGFKYDAFTVLERPIPDVLAMVIVELGQRWNGRDTPARAGEAWQEQSWR